MTTDYAELIGRLEAASGPDRKLDVEIGALVSGLNIEHFRDSIEQIGVKGSGWTPSEEEWPLYTGSIDAALTLVPEGWAWFVEQIEGFTNGDARLWIPSQRTRGLLKENVDVRNAATPAIALCIAALRARASERQEKQ